MASVDAVRVVPTDRACVVRAPRLGDCGQVRDEQRHLLAGAPFGTPPIWPASTVSYRQFGEYSRHVHARGPVADDQLGGDLAIAHTLAEQCENLEFSRGEIELVKPCLGSGRRLVVRGQVDSGRSRQGLQRLA